MVAGCSRRMETATETRVEDAAAKSAAAKRWPLPNSGLVSCYRSLNDQGRNRESNYFRDSYCFQATTFAYRSASSLPRIRAIFSCH
jgi:hypothetical protein